MKQFDLVEALQRRDDGIKQVADNNPRFLEVARRTARRLAARGHSVTSDMVRRDCPLEPLHPNAWGAVFKGGEWEWTGQYRKSSLVQGHGNMQRVWRLK